MNDDYFMEDCIRSWDISFCMSDCKNTLCARNKNSKLYKRMIQNSYKGIHSETDFHGRCNNYKN